MITNSSLIHYSDYFHSDRTENKDFLISSVISGKFCDSNRVFAPPASMVCGSGIARAVCNGFLAGLQISCGLGNQCRQRVSKFICVSVPCRKDTMITYR